MPESAEQGAARVLAIWEASVPARGEALHSALGAAGYVSVLYDGYKNRDAHTPHARRGKPYEDYYILFVHASDWDSKPQSTFKSRVEHLLFYSGGGGAYDRIPEGAERIWRPVTEDKGIPSVYEVKEIVEYFEELDQLRAQGMEDAPVRPSVLTTAEPEMLPALGILCQGYLGVWASPRDTEKAASGRGDWKDVAVGAMKQRGQERKKRRLAGEVTSKEGEHLCDIEWALNRMGWLTMRPEEVALLAENLGDYIDEVRKAKWWDVFGLCDTFKPDEENGAADTQAESSEDASAEPTSKRGERFSKGNWGSFLKGIYREQPS